MTMAAPAAMKRFEVKPSGKDFVMHIVNDQDEMLEMTCSRDQLDVLADALDDILLIDDSGDEVQDKA